MLADSNGVPFPLNCRKGGIKTPKQYTKELPAPITSNTIEIIFETEEPIQVVGANRVDTFLEIDAVKRKEPPTDLQRSSKTRRVVVKFRCSN
jgi:hypothetical protein